MAMLTEEEPIREESWWSEWSGFAISLLLHVLFIALLLILSRFFSPDIPPPPMEVEVVPDPQSQAKPPPPRPQAQPRPQPQPHQQPQPQPQPEKQPSTRAQGDLPKPQLAPGDLDEHSHAGNHTQAGRQAVDKGASKTRPNRGLTVDIPQQGDVKAGDEEGGESERELARATQTARDMMLAQVFRYWRPAEVLRGTKSAIRLRVQLNPDGMLASPFSADEPYNPRRAIGGYGSYQPDDPRRVTLEGLYLALVEAQPFRLPPKLLQRAPLTLVLDFRIDDAP